MAIENHDIIVVGAGISGCGAAWYLQKEGRPSLILEANSRSGGKTYTVPDGYRPNGHVDLGASWVNDTTQSHVNALIEELGLERLQQNIDGLDITQSFELSFFAHEHHQSVRNTDTAFTTFFAKFNDIVESINLEDVASSPSASQLDSKTILEWIQETCPDQPAMPQRVETFVRAAVGADPAQTSMLYFAHYIAGLGGVRAATGYEKGHAQYQRLVNGTQGISSEVLARLPQDTLRLNHAVDTISQTEDIVKVITKDGQVFHAKHVILTIPPVLWTSIKWSPPLPENKILISNSLAMPAYSKIVFVFEKDWWRPKFSGAVFFFQGPIQFVRETSVPSKSCFNLTCFCTGANGALWGRQSKAGRQQSAWQALTSAFMNWIKLEDIPKPVAVHEMRWEGEQYFAGAPSGTWPPNMLSKGLVKDLKAPHHNVHFAGSETSSTFKGAIEGGLEAAERAVKQIIAKSGN